MALSQSPQGSPDMNGRIALMPSPPPQPSKRDKRRAQLADRLADITMAFSQNRDLHYRQELLALQIDMHLITEADVHTKAPLDDMGDEIRRHAEGIAERTMLKNIPVPERAGKIYMEFAKEVNNAMEQRDADLATHMRNYEVELAKINAGDAYRRKLAANEHKALSSTLRDRLINSLNSKKARLSRDKETIEIAESNAQTLHPHQFSIGNPDSPSGQHGKRATRNRRDIGDDTVFSETKRKRKAADSDESPAPPIIEKRSRLENGISTPTWHGDRPWRNERSKLETSQIKKGLYSIEKLFTEKELSMSYNNAAMAAHVHMVRHPPYGNDGLDTPPAGRNGTTSDAEKNRGAGDFDDDEAPSPVNMERQPSHATRSTRNPQPPINLGMGVEGLVDLNYPGSMNALSRQIPKLPPHLPSLMQKAYVKGDTANQPSGLSAEEAAAELEIIRYARKYNDEVEQYGRNLDRIHLGRQLLTEVAYPKRPTSPNSTGKISYFIKSDGREMLSHLRTEIAMTGAEPMSKQSSRGYNSDVGGTPMSRQDTNDAGMSSRGRKGRTHMS